MASRWVRCKTSSSSKLPVTPRCSSAAITVHHRLALAVLSSPHSGGFESKTSSCQILNNNRIVKAHHHVPPSPRPPSSRMKCWWMKDAAAWQYRTGSVFLRVHLHQLRIGANRALKRSLLFCKMHLARLCYISRIILYRPSAWKGMIAIGKDAPPTKPSSYTTLCALFLLLSKCHT